MLNTSVEVVHAVILAEGDGRRRQEIHLIAISAREKVRIEFCLSQTYSSFSATPMRDSVLWSPLILFAA